MPGADSKNIKKAAVMILRAEEIVKTYKDDTVISIKDFHVKRGETVSIIGPSGVGKTTFFNILSGLDRPDSGRVFFRDEDITGKPGVLGYMQQKDLLLEHRTLIRNLCLPLILKGSEKGEAEEEAEKYLRDFGLEGCENLYPSQLSGGMRQRAALLRTFLYSRDLLLLDEPFSALDEITRISLHEWYKKIRGDYGTSAVLVTHSITEALSLSDRIYVMNGKPGTFTAEFEADKTCTGEILEYLRV